LLARSAGRSGPEDFVGLTGLTAPALLGWGLRRACDCVCLECVCVGRSLLKDVLRKVNFL
jgi:hypothetical protein